VLCDARIKQISIKKVTMNSKIHIKDKSDTGKLITVSRFKQEIRKTNPHKHNNYFEIIYLTEGKGTHFIDHDSYQIQPPVVFFIRKEQVHYWTITDRPAGYVMIIKKDLFFNTYDQKLKQLLSKVSSISALPLISNSTIPTFFNLLINENNLTLREGLLKALLVKILNSAKSVEIEQNSTDLFLAYKQLLTNSNSLINNVAHYADLLKTSPQNLNHICKKMKINLLEKS